MRSTRRRRWRVWGDKGPVIVRWERPRRPITVNVITGTVL